jgi:DNA-binding transcriptional ArsR family regulator
MPTPESSFISTSVQHRVWVALEPAQNAIQSLLLISREEELSGLGDWVIRTARSLSRRVEERHRLVMIGMYFAVLPQRRWPSFPAYLDTLEGMPPQMLQDKLLKAYARISLKGKGAFKSSGEEAVDLDKARVLASPESYLTFLRGHFSDHHIDVELETRAYSYVVDPPAMKSLIVSHLKAIWEQHLASEWIRVEPMLRESVEAFRRLDFSDMSKLEAAQIITGQEMQGWEDKLETERPLIFIPNAHIGPYLAKFNQGEALGIVFGARLPSGSRIVAPDLSRAEIVVRLGALADDTRLRILHSIAQEGELNSQEIIRRFDLSQSAASRQLKQLSATGYLSERRCNGAKCYQLNPERIEDTLRAVSSFLLGRS